MANASATVASSKTGVSRREFLYYIWGASIALVTAEFAGLLIWFLIPLFREGQFGGNFNISADAIPGVNEPPISISDGRFWLVDVDTAAANDLMYPVDVDPTGGIKGVLAIYKVCTHLGCIYDWNDANSRFECPCHGSKYRLDGRRIESPAPRTLDRFHVTIVDADGNELDASPIESVEGTDVFGAVPLPAGAATLRVNTGDKKDGAAQTLICTFTNSC